MSRIIGFIIDVLEAREEVKHTRGRLTSGDKLFYGRRQRREYARSDRRLVDVNRYNERDMCMGTDRGRCGLRGQDSQYHVMQHDSRYLGRPNEVDARYTFREREQKAPPYRQEGQYYTNEGKQQGQTQDNWNYR